LENYSASVRDRWANKREGQHFLIDKSIAEIEAAYGEGRNVLEMGSGMGILTEALCKVAKKVVSVEKDSGLFERLEYTLTFKNLKLINKDFFELEDKEIGKSDIMISNIPYKLSSKVVFWLGQKGMSAVLCVQKEFAEHMMASPGSKSYSRLSVESGLRFKVYRVREVPPTCFHPRPHVNSEVIYIVPKEAKISAGADAVINALMNHKKKTLRNALMDSCKTLGIGKPEMAEIAGQLKDSKIRPVHMEPEALLGVAKEVSKYVGINS
jgi:16S rRNA (adenine1518-N6/adenine1519-N6)-dimethyltransferase